MGLKRNWIEHNMLKYSKILKFNEEVCQQARYSLGEKLGEDKPLVITQNATKRNKVVENMR